MCHCKLVFQQLSIGANVLNYVLLQKYVVLFRNFVIQNICTMAIILVAMASFNKCTLRSITCFQVIQQIALPGNTIKVLNQHFFILTSTVAKSSSRDKNSFKEDVTRIVIRHVASTMISIVGGFHLINFTSHSKIYINGWCYVAFWIESSKKSV